MLQPLGTGYALLPSGRFLGIFIYMSPDITELLEEWPYDPESTIRIVTANDGRSVLQVRLPLGIEQYELDGRPDGIKPHGHQSYLDYIDSRLQEFVREYRTDAGFVVSHEEYLRLHEEGTLFYYRYLLLFQINDFERVLRDTSHNLRICALVEKYVQSEEDKNALLQYKPYILRMNALARSMLLIQRREEERAKEVLSDTIEQIRSLPDVDSPTFQFEKIRSINYLTSTLKQLRGEQEDTLERLKKELEKAVQEENYELAAKLRDQIRELE
ncbi:MAG: UvrB/UvrC motif-containing protein [Spirochaetales bacterium]